MGEYKRVADILAAIVDREQIHGIIEPRVPPALKYKKGHKPGAETLPDLRVGAKLVITCTAHGGWGFNFGGGSYGTVIGYALGIVIDFYTRGDDAELYYDANAIVQIVRVTHPSLQKMVGHLRAISVGTYHSGTRFAPEQVQLSDFKWIETQQVEGGK